MKCLHKNLVIYEQVAGKRVFTSKPFKQYIDWNSNIINAHYLRVTKYMCVNCGEIIEAPRDEKDE